MIPMFIEAWRYRGKDAQHFRVKILYRLRKIEVRICIAWCAISCLNIFITFVVVQQNGLVRFV